MLPADFEATVSSPAFASQSLLQQHGMACATLGRTAAVLARSEGLTAHAPSAELHLAGDSA